MIVVSSLPDEAMGSRRILIDTDAIGTRLDVYLASRVAVSPADATLSRANIQRLIEEGGITVNGLRTKPSLRLKLDDLVEIEIRPPQNPAVSAEPLSLEIIYEDADCLVINKAAGMVVHPAAGCESGTVVNALLHHCGDLAGIGGERRPGIVHRLDKDTSGVMIVAKNAFAFGRLARQFKLRTVTKEYVALVWGKLAADHGVIDRPIGRHRSDRKKMSSLRSLGKTRDAVTEWQVEQCFFLDDDVHARSVSWLRLKPRTGRTHQIRVHLADLGHSIVGDKVYGRKIRPVRGRAVLLDSFPRQVLHAECLVVDHPRTGARVAFRAAVPEDIRGLLQALSKGSAREHVELGVDKNRAFK
jgi:23S rRNA pseudouridine1911/1915/1917 synthase